MEDAAERGVRLTGEVTLHLRSCRACRRAHREIRRRRRVRVALLLPLGLAVRTAGLRDRLRDLIAMNPAWEAQASAAKLCTAACLTAVGAGGVASPAVVSTVVLPTATPMTVQVVKDKPKPKKKKRAQAEAHAGPDGRRDRGPRDLDADAAAGGDRGGGEAAGAQAARDAARRGDRGRRRQR